MNFYHLYGSKYFRALANFLVLAIKYYNEVSRFLIPKNCQN